MTMTDDKEAMSNDPVDGGTVTYHRAEWHGDFWKVWWSEDDTRHWVFPPDVGEAMGLTVSEPAPLVVTCNGHSVELSDEEAEFYTVDWEGTVDHSPHGSCATKLAHLLRDARQDPQPTVDSEPWPWGDEGFMCPKMLRETLGVAQAAVNDRTGDARRSEHSRRIQQMLDWCDRHRPIGPNGKHGTRRCTPTCGCEDKREPITPVQPTAASPSVAGVRDV